MRNLKRALSLVLAAMMLIGMMVVSAGAASKDFTDKDEITHTEAVEVMTALNVISGKEDGSYFDPTGTLTRAEMAKIVAYVMNGGVEPVLGVKDVPTYSDIDGHWAEKYIEYCTSMEIIVGDGAGKFNPEGTLTAEQCAKMFLTAMGYNANVFGFTGNSWATNTNRYANEAGLYKELGSVQASAPISRDNAAQMAYNAIQATMMRRTWSQDMETGKLTETYAPWVDGTTTHTLLGEKFEANVEYAYMENITYDSVKKEYTYTFKTSSSSFGDNIAAADALAQLSLKDDVDYSGLFGQKVKVIYKDSASEKYPVYGMYSAATVLAESAYGNITDEDGNALAADTVIKMGDTKVTLDSAKTTTTVAVANFNTTASTDLEATPTERTAYSMVAAIDNSGDGKADCFVVYPATAAKVTYSGTTSITAGANFLYDKDEDNYYVYGTSSVTYNFPEVAKNDYVLIPAYGISGLDREVTKLDKFEGKVTGLSATKAQVEGEWYKLNGQSLTLDSTYELVQVNGFLVGSSVITAASKDVAMVIAADASSALSGIKAKLMFADGTQAIVEISKVNGTTVSGSQTLSVNYSIADGTLVTYSKKDDGTYEVKDLSSSNLAGYDSYASSLTDFTAANSSTGTPAKLGGQLIADDAVIFVKYNTSGTAKYTVITGAALKTYGNITTTSEALLGSSNGISSIKVANIVTASTTFSSSNAYGYVLTAPYAIKENDTNLWAYDMWTVDGLVSVKDDVTSAPAKGSVVYYVVNNNGTITSSADLNGDDAGTPTMTNVAITGYSETDKLVTMNTTTGGYYGAAGATPIKDDTKILFVDTKANTGAEGGSIELAQATPNGGYYANAMALYDGGELKLLVIDTNNNLNRIVSGSNTDYIACGFTVTPATLAGTTTGYSITTDKTKAVQGETITVTITSNGTGTQTKAETAVTGGSVTVADTTLTASTVASYDITFACGSADTGAITVTLS